MASATPTENIDAWREAHAHLTLAIAAAEDSIIAEKSKRRYLMQEICANVTPEGKLSATSTWKVTAASSTPTASKAASASVIKKTAKATSSANGLRLEKDMKNTNVFLDKPTKSKASATKNKMTEAFETKAASKQTTQPSKKIRFTISAGKTTADDSDLDDDDESTDTDEEKEAHAHRQQKPATTAIAPPLSDSDSGDSISESSVIKEAESLASSFENDHISDDDGNVESHQAASWAQISQPSHHQYPTSTYDQPLLQTGYYGHYSTQNAPIYSHHLNHHSFTPQAQHHPPQQQQRQLLPPQYESDEDEHAIAFQQPQHRHPQIGGMHDSFSGGASDSLFQSMLQEQEQMMQGQHIIDALPQQQYHHSNPLSAYQRYDDEESEEEELD